MNISNQIVTNISGHARMLDVLREGLTRSFQVDIAVSYVRHSGVSLLLRELKKFSQRGGTARILATTSMHITQPEALKTLQGLPGIECRLHASNMLRNATSEGFHAKLYVFKSTTDDEMSFGSVGSSNFSSGGLVSNIESNVLLTRAHNLLDIETLFETLWTHPDVVSLSHILTPYNEAYLQAMALQKVRQTFLNAQHTLLDTQHIAVSPNEAQKEALASLQALRDEGEKRALVVAATGVGKTFLAAFDAKQCKASRVLFLSHRLEHLLQAKASFEKVFGKSRTQGLVYGSSKEYDRDHIFATIQSMGSASAARLDESFDYVVIDEFHHADAPSYRKVINRLKYKFLLGLTATPERADGNDILRLCDYNVAYEVRLVEAIERQWLIPFHYFGIADETVDYDKIPWKNNRFDPTELENALMLEARVEHILKHATEHGYDGVSRMTAGFCAGVRHARFMARSFTALLGEGSAQALTGEDSLEERQRVYANLQNPEHPLQWLFVADLLNEGVDLPHLNSLLFLRPTQSPTVFLQQLGRGLRKSPTCDVLTVLDFVGHHRLAWATIQTLNDSKAAQRNPSKINELDLTPPRFCEVVLDEKTLEMLQTIRNQRRTKRDMCDEAYLRLREELGRPPMPIDLYGMENLPDYPADWRSARGSFMAFRVEHGDAASWEQSISQDHPCAKLLRSLEKNWQQQRVQLYALIWALVYHHYNQSLELEDAYEAFFMKFSRWSVEYRPFAELSGKFKALQKKADVMVQNHRLDVRVFEHFEDEDEALFHVEGRVLYWLQQDFVQRHLGVLRMPSQLVLHRRYARHEIINHFGIQFDPARHNAGVITFKDDEPCPDDYVLISKVDTSNAQESYQYDNGFLNAAKFAWQSQNKHRQDRSTGQSICEHQERGITLHLFVQASKQDLPLYCGPVRVLEARGNAPINFKLQLETPLPQELFEFFTS